MKNTIFTGVATAVVTPMNEDGSINFDRLREFIDEQIEANKERLEKQLEKKAEERKTEQKEFDKERLEALKGGDGKKVVTASSVEELLVKIQDAAFELRSNNLMTEQEKLVGQKFDFSV